MKIAPDHLTDTYETKRLAELEEEIPRIDAAMEDARHRIEKFVERNPQCRTIFAHRLPAVRIGGMELRHPDLRALESELDNLVLRWHAVLAEFADLKAKMSRRESTAAVSF
jgi:hypothetical protein